MSPDRSPAACTGRLPARGRRLGAALGAVVTVVVTGAVLSACGVPIDAQPSALSRNGIPFGLLNPAPPSTTTTLKPSSVEVPVQIFLIGPTGHLVAVARDVPVSAPDLFTVLGALVLGPTDVEQAAGLQSALSEQTTILGATIVGKVATVNMGGSFGKLVGPPQIQAVAQIVFTASALPGVDGVSFELSGVPVEVPVASGAQVPVATTSQFAPYAPS